MDSGKTIQNIWIQRPYRIQGLPGSKGKLETTLKREWRSIGNQMFRNLEEIILKTVPRFHGQTTVALIVGLPRLENRGE